jgi:hypothetical protein
LANRKNLRVISSKKSNFNRHRGHCSICAHPQREEIEREFISWKSPAKIVDEYGLQDRTALYRHAHAVGLFSKRSLNNRAALERIIERGDDAPVTAGAVVQAVALHARINARGELVERDERVGFQDLFAKMTFAELDAYAKDGTLPSWFPRSKDTKGQRGGENE